MTSVGGELQQSLHMEEYQADYIAACAARNFGIRKQNPFLIYCTGQMLMLFLADMVRRSREIIETGNDRENFSDTHPTITDRITYLSNWLIDTEKTRSLEQANIMQETF